MIDKEFEMISDHKSVTVPVGVGSALDVTREFVPVRVIESHADSLPVFPYWDRVLVQRDEYVPTGAIIAPDAAVARNYTGTVIAVGPGRKSARTGKWVPIPVNPGDKIAYGPFAGTEITLEDGSVLSFFKEEELYGIISHDAELDPESVLPSLY